MSTLCPGKKVPSQGRDGRISRPVEWSCITYSLRTILSQPWMPRNRSSSTACRASQELMNCRWTGAFLPIASSKMKGSSISVRCSGVESLESIVTTASYVRMLIESNVPSEPFTSKQTFWSQPKPFAILSRTDLHSERRDVLRLTWTWN